MHNTTLAELLLTHLCHEFAGPVGAISNGAELLEETDSSVYLQARKLVQSSAKDIIYRLQFYRAAYGVCSTSGEADLSLLVQICNNYISQRREVTLTWPVVLPEFSSIEAKLLQNCLILLLRQLRQGGSVELVVANLAKGGVFELVGKATNLLPASEYCDILRGSKPPAPLDLDAASYLYTYLIAEKLGYKVTAQYSKEMCSFLVVRK